MTVAPDYRVWPETAFPGFLDAAAVRWARDHATEHGGDPNVVMEHSAGAHIAAMLATDPRYLQAKEFAKSVLAGMISLAGPYTAIPPEPHMSDVFPAALRARRHGRTQALSGLRARPDRHDVSASQRADSPVYADVLAFLDAR